MKRKTTLILLALVFALGGFFLFYVIQQPSESELAEAKGRVFQPREFENPLLPGATGLSSRVTRLEFTRGGDTIIMSRTLPQLGGQWRIQSPVEARADAGYVSALLSMMEFITASRTLEAEPGRELNPADYGLQEPKLSLTVGVDDKRWTLLVGDRTPDGGSAYARRADRDAIYVVPDIILQGAEWTLDDLRHKAAIYFSPAAALRVSLAAPGRSQVILLRDGNSWRMTEPVKEPADALAVRQLLASLASLRFEPADILAEAMDDPSEYGLDEPAYEFTVLEGEETRALRIGNQLPEDSAKRYASHSGDSTLFALAVTDIEKLALTPNDLRTRAALSFRPQEITAIQMTANGETTELKRLGDRWEITRPENAEADSDYVQVILNDLANMTVEGWPETADPPQTGLDAPRVRLTLTTESGNELPILFGNPHENAEKSFASRGEETAVLLVSSDLPNRLAAGHLAFVSRRILEFPRPEAIGLEIATSSGRLKVEKHGEEWRTVEPAGATVDPVKLDDALWALSWFAGRSVVAENPQSLAPYGLEDPRAIITVTLQPEGEAAVKRVVLLGGELANGESYAMLENAGRVLLIGAAQTKLLLDDLIQKPEAK